MPSIIHTIDSYAVVLQTPGGFLELRPLADHIIRVRFGPTPIFSSTPSLMRVPVTEVTVNSNLQETPDSFWFTTPQLQVQILKETGALTWRDPSGQLLTKEPDRGGRALQPTKVVVSTFDENAAPQLRKDADGVHAYTPAARQVVDRAAYHAKLEFEWQPGEALYGLGSHEEGMLNLRGQHQYLYQQNMKVVVPVLVSTRGYGILLDNYSLQTFHDDAFGSYLWAEVADELDYYFIYGPEFDQIVQGIRQLTGKVPLLPRWSFGYIQSKERYVSQAELIEIVHEYRNRGLPLDCIVQDWKSWPNDLWGQKSLDPERFPDPKGLLDELHHLNARLMISLWPNMNPGGENWHEMKAAGCLLGNQATYNAFQQQGRELYWQQTNTGLFAHGVDAWWCDCTEPFQADWNGSYKPEPEERLRINTSEAKTYLDPQYINAYSLLHSQGIYEGQRGTSETKRVVNLTRSAYAGQQRFSTVTWSGDVCATWETLRRQIAEGLNFCATGLPYWTVDIGAFFVKNDPALWFWKGDFDAGVDDLGYRELYVRWFQYAAFLPMFRAHGTDTPRELWRFGQPGEVFYDSLIKFLRLRYRLLPYIYSLAGQVTHDDYTLLRALPFDFRADPMSYDVRDQYMFGPALLVNPVTQPMYYAPKSTPLSGVSQTRAVYLPQGAAWYDFWTGQRYSGGQTILADAPLDTMPLYVRAGSIIPMGPDIQHSGEGVNQPIDLLVYPGQDGHFTLYEDEGDNYNYEHGQFSTIGVSWNELAHVLTLHARQGSYPNMPHGREFRIVLANQPHPQGSARKTVLYDGHQTSVDLSLTSNV